MTALSQKEIAVLHHILKNDFGTHPSYRSAEYKFNCWDFQVWRECIGDSTSELALPKGKSLSGTVSSLVCKGLLACDGECVMFTEAGFRQAVIVDQASDMAKQLLSI